MPPKTTRGLAEKALRIGTAPDGTGGIGSSGVDLITKDGSLVQTALRRADRVRIGDGGLTRALGPKRLKVFAPAAFSRTFADVAKYGTIPAAAQLRLAYGGFGVHFSITALRGGATGQILHGQDGADGTPPFDFSLSSAGVLTTAVNWDGGGSASVSSAVLTDASVQHGWFIHDAVLGTVTLYLNGSSVGTPVTGLGTGKRPLQTASMAWLVGAKKSAAAVVTLPFMGKIDALQVQVFGGLQIASGNPSLLSTLLAHSLRQWPNPREPRVVAQYDFDEASGTVMKDRSRFANHGTYTGAPTASAAVAWSFPVGNLCSAFEGADGSRKNTFGSGGALFYETTRS